MKLKIEVTAEDIRQGVRNNAFNCPIAHALRRASGHNAVRVDVCDLTVNSAGEGLRSAPLPPEAESFLVLFDSSLDVAPFTFEVEL